MKINIDDDKVTNQIDSLIKNYENQLGNINQKFENKIDKIQSGDELLPGVLKLIKVFVAVKESFNLEIKWQVGMETKVLYPKFVLQKICHI